MYVFVRMFHPENEMYDSALPFSVYSLLFFKIYFVFDTHRPGALVYALTCINRLYLNEWQHRNSFRHTRHCVFIKICANTLSHIFDGLAVVVCIILRFSENIILKNVLEYCPRILRRNGVLKIFSRSYHNTTYWW